jgi:hypothetical protein
MERKSPPPPHGATVPSVDGVVFYRRVTSTLRHTPLGTFAPWGGGDFSSPSLSISFKY